MKTGGETTKSPRLIGKHEKVETTISVCGGVDRQVAKKVNRFEWKTSGNYN